MTEDSMIKGTVEKIVAGGYGLVRATDGVVFVRAVAPGEEITARIVRRQRGVAWAELVEVRRASPERVPMPCPHYPICGGCDFLHMTREAELRAKESLTAETMRRVSRLDLPLAAFTTVGEPLGYRNTVRLQGGAGYLGYCRKGSEEIVDITDCLIALPAIRSELGRWKEAMQPPYPRNLILRAHASDETGEGNDADRPVTILATRRQETEIQGGSLRMRLRGRDYRVDPRSFFQVNLPVASRLIGDLAERLPDASRLVDLFAGVGAFALSFAGRYPAIVGCEISRSAVEDFQANAAGLEGVTVVEWDAARGLKEELKPDDIVIVDPPRTGLPPRLTHDLAGAGPSRLAYVSCEASTFARDLAQLIAAGYRLSEPVRMYDMFPRTAHAELLGILERDGR